jgi:hypothetical protein
MAQREGYGDSDGGGITGAWLYPHHRKVADERSEAMNGPRRSRGATVKAQVALAALKDDKTLAESAEQFSVRPT